MIEEIIIQYLSGILTVPVRHERPENPPESFVLVERTGGGMRNQIRTAMIAIQSYAESAYAAEKLNEQVISAMLDAIQLNSIGGIGLNSTYNYTDTSEKRHRYQAVFDVTYY